MLSVDGQDIQGNALGEDVDGVLGPGVQVVVVPLMFHDETADVGPVVVLVDVQLELWDDRCHCHGSSSFEIKKPDF